MPKFGQMWFNGYYFGDSIPVFTPFGKSIKRIPLGFSVRKKVLLYHSLGVVKFGQVKFGKEKFGAIKAIYGDLQTDKAVIFETYRGNGFAGSKLGKLYHSKFKYVVPSSINNPEGQPARDALKQAVLNWQTTVTDDEKKYYNWLARHGYKMSGYNLYISRYMKANL